MANPSSPTTPLTLLDILKAPFQFMANGIKQLVIKDQTTQTVRSPLGAVIQSSVATELQITGDPAVIQAITQAQLTAQQAAQLGTANPPTKKP